MAEGRMLKHKLVRSRRFRRLYDDPFAQLVYCLLVSAVDNWGMMPADGATIKAEVGPFDERKAVEYEQAAAKLHEVGLIYTWDDQGDPWLMVCGHDEEQKRGITRRKGDPQVPRPTQEIIDAHIKHTSCTHGARIEHTTCDTHAHTMHAPNTQGSRTPHAGVTHDACKGGVEGKGSEVEGEGEGEGEVLTHAPALDYVEEEPPPPAMLPPRQQDLAVELREVSEAYRQAWDMDEPPPIEGDTRTRIMQAIRKHGVPGVVDAIHGHHEREAKKGEWTALHYAFPMLSVNGSSDRRKLDGARFLEYAEAGKRVRRKAEKVTKAKQEHTQAREEVVERPDPETAKARLAELRAMAFKEVG